MTPQGVSDTFGLNQACRCWTKSLFSTGSTRLFLLRLCVPVQGDDAVGQLYLIPAVVHHVSGGTQQAVRTQNESEADRPDCAATGDRGQQRDREQLAECVTEVRLRRADLGLHVRGGYFSTGLSLMLASGTKCSTSSAEITPLTRPSREEMLEHGSPPPPRLFPSLQLPWKNQTNWEAESPSLLQGAG